MKLVAITALALLAGCKDKAPPPSGVGSSAKPTAPSPVPAAPASPNAPAAAPASGSAAAGSAAAGSAAQPPPDICMRGLAVLERAACPTPEVQKNLLDAKQAIDSLVETSGKVGGGTDPRQFQVLCAQMLLAIERDAAKLRCKIDIPEAQRREITSLLDSWYGQRTPVTPTGDAASDAVIAKIAAVRDAACACTDGPCLDRLNPQLAAVGTLPSTAPAAARTLGSKLLEDAARCATRVRTFSPAPAPGAPAGAGTRTGSGAPAGVGARAGSAAAAGSAAR